MVPVQEPTPDVESIESAFGLEAAISDSSDPPLPFSTILINNIPIGEYFPLPGDRERAVRPLKIAGVLGAYNIFSLVRGGGTTGQSDALAHGISKGLLVHDTSLATLLRRSELLYLSRGRPILISLKPNFCVVIHGWSSGRRPGELRRGRGSVLSPSHSK
jgi:small subunit ribosomal protein S9